MNWRIKQDLYIDIHQAIEETISELKSTQEPDYIAALVTKLPAQLTIVLNKHLKYLKFQVGGYFIHQKPLAKFCDPNKYGSKKPEIGDLLIVYKEVRTDGDMYNALLLQAKKSTNIYKTVVSNSDKHQLTLYTKWPNFEYHRAGSLNGEMRNIQPKSITPGAQYLLIDNNHSPLLDTTFWCAIPDNFLVANKSLALQIINLIEFQTGRPFGEKNKENIDHWSKMIWDLLSLSVNSIFNRRHAGYESISRQAGDLFSKLNNNNTEFTLSNEEGISVIYIEGSLNESNEEK